MIDAVNAFRRIEERLIGYDWCKEDEEVMRQFYPRIGIKVKSMLSVERSINAILGKAQKMGLKRDRWEDEKIVILKNNFSKYGTNGMKRNFFPEMSKRTIKKMADELGLVYIRNRWDNEDKVFLIENYKIMSRQELAKALNRSKGSIGVMMHKLNLKRYEKC